MYGYDSFAYNKWATLELFNACRKLTEEQLDFHLPGVSGPTNQMTKDVDVDLPYYGKVYRSP